MKKTNSQAKFAPQASVKKRYVLILLILAVMVGHFTIQMRLIESEQPLISVAPILERNSQPKSNIEIPIKVFASDEVLPSQPLELSSNQPPLKIVQREVKRPLEPAPKPIIAKKEVINESKSARLRRAEKILTGF